MFLIGFNRAEVWLRLWVLWMCHAVWSSVSGWLSELVSDGDACCTLRELVANEYVPFSCKIAVRNTGQVHVGKLIG